MRLLLIIITFLLPFNAFSVGPTDSVDFGKLDIEYLEMLVKTKIDSLRELNGFYPLKYNFALNKAAEDHAFYLMTHQEVSHHQQFYKKRDVLQRVRFFGAENVQKAGENVLWKHPGRKYTWDKKRGRYKAIFYHTYRSLSDAIVKAWVKSPDHYRNFLTPDYHYTAVAIAFDSKKKELMCVQVFATFQSIDKTGVVHTR